jgi:aspartyl-tRNA(Asn)/glutamyl-tRNA(Gln) amidotransferase subunit C
MIPYTATNSFVFFDFLLKYPDLILIRMALTLDDVKRVAQLARIAVDEHESQAALTQLSAIFQLIEQMQTVETTNVEPMSHAQQTTLRLREDQVTETDQRALFQSVAPQVEAGLYLVPKVIE